MAFNSLYTLVPSSLITLCPSGFSHSGSFFPLNLSHLLICWNVLIYINMYTFRWGNSGNSVRLYFLGSKITADGDCRHEIKRCLLLGRKVMTNLDSILKSRDITLPTKVHLVKAMVFPVVMYGYESWSQKETEH